MCMTESDPVLRRAAVNRIAFSHLRFCIDPALQRDRADKKQDRPTEQDKDVRRLNGLACQDAPRGVGIMVCRRPFCDGLHDAWQRLNGGPQPAQHRGHQVHQCSERLRRVASQSDEYAKRGKRQGTNPEPKRDRKPRAARERDILGEVRDEKNAENDKERECQLRQDFRERVSEGGERGCSQIAHPAALPFCGQSYAKRIDRRSDDTKRCHGDHKVVTPKRPRNSQCATLLIDKDEIEDDRHSECEEKKAAITHCADELVFPVVQGCSHCASPPSSVRRTNASSKPPPCT